MSRIAFLLLMAPLGVQAQVSFERILNAAEEPHNWLTYSGTYAGTRYSCWIKSHPPTRPSWS